ncbi:hypothetical protein [Anaerococcus marasmi]|uniref:hypothetical protein n=1 Tax=Anaerococcus marasmi TaxID=2057797 RepID=UPI000CF9B93B|nr:hypothetical protein [Anaerococcus marasmi]
MKIADAVINFMKEECKENGWDIKDWHIVPFDRHDFCWEALKLAGKLPNAERGEHCRGYEYRYKDCKSIADALERDKRFRKTLTPHQVLRRMFYYVGGKKSKRIDL